MFFTVFTFLAGSLAIIGIGLLVKYVASLKGKKKGLAWLLIGLWYAWTITGLSFVIASVMEKHHRAATVGSFIFFTIAIATAVLLARWIGIIKINQKKDKPANA